MQLSASLRMRLALNGPSMPLLVLIEYFMAPPHRPAVRPWCIILPVSAGDVGVIPCIRRAAHCANRGACPDDRPRPVATRRDTFS